jgi:5-methylcytosine-specific restriction endonuclease McrA
MAAEEPMVCVDCGGAFASELMHLDHDVPKSRGGGEEPGNLKWRCQGCHAAKTAREDGGFGNPA